MASLRSNAEGAGITPDREAAQAVEIPDDVLANVAAGSVAQIVLTVIVVLAVCYVAKLVMITIASSLLLAFVLEPIVWRLERWHVPRAAGSFMAVLLLLGCIYGAAHFSYNSAAAFLHDLKQQYTTELLHLSPDPSQLGRVYATRWAATGDPKATITALLPLVGGRVDSAAVAVAVAAAGATRHAAVQQLEDTALSRYDAAPMDPMAAAHALVRAMPTGSLIVDEAITTGVYVRGFHHEPVPGRYFFNRGGGLGWGMPAAVGVSLARGGEPVLCAVGDGSAMYSPQALWTAAREELPVVFAVVNNRQYLILKNNLRGMGGDSVRHDRFVAMDLVDPPIDYLSLATSMGVAATLVEKAHDVGDAVQAALDSHRPHLLELPIAAP